MKSAIRSQICGIALLLCLGSCTSCSSKKEKITYSGSESDMASARGRLQPIGEVKSLANSNQCLYYQDFETGNIMRVSLDGRERELVIRCGIVRGMHLDLSLPTAKAEGRITMPCVPSPGGYTVVDTTPAQLATQIVIDSGGLVPAIEEPVRIALAPIANTNVPTKWKYRFSYDDHILEPGHFHSFIDVVYFESGNLRRDYDFVDEDSYRSNFTGMADDNHAVIVDYPNVFVWNLLTDDKICIANTIQNPVVWPRDLYSNKRFVPILNLMNSTEIYKWELSSPGDIHPRPEYRKERKISSIYRTRLPLKK